MMAVDQGILVLNSGSSSLKFALYRSEGLAVACQGQVEGKMTAPRFSARDADGRVLGEHDWTAGTPIDTETALRFVLEWLESLQKQIRIAAVGHRLVQGGTRYFGPTLVDADALDYLQGLTMSEPQNLPAEVNTIRIVRRLHPDLPQVAAFDTSFHRTMPEIAELYAVPKQVHDEGVRRWGYHGISYDYINRTLPDYDPEAKRVIVCHLGSGASMCAIQDGKSIATSMGFSGIEGLPMGTRCGAIDPGALLYLLRRKLYDERSLEHLLYEESGLKGLSGISNDMRTLLESDAPEAKRAIDYFVYQIVFYAGAYTALLGGLDALVFTAGIGEHAAPIRAAVCRRLQWLGLDLDEAANGRHGPRISADGGRVRTWVIPTNEEIMVARHTVALSGV